MILKPNFVCPNCGSSSLYLKGDFTYKLKFPIKKVIWEPIMHSFLVTPNLSGRYLQEVKGASCYCGDCGFEVVSQSSCLDSDYNYLIDDLVEWLSEQNILQGEEKNE